MLLVLSHGQASVERGFSINKQTKEIHLQTKTFVAKRITCDHDCYVGGIDHVDVTCKELLLAATRQNRNTSCTLMKVKRRQKQSNQIESGRP